MSFYKTLSFLVFIILSKNLTAMQPTAEDTFYTEILHKGIRDRNIATIQRAISSGKASLAATDKHRSALCQLAATEHKDWEERHFATFIQDSLDLLVKSGADIHEKIIMPDKQELDLMQVAFRFENIQMAHALASAGFKPAKDQLDLLFLSAVGDENYVRAANYLKAGADINTRTFKSFPSHGYDLTAVGLAVSSDNVRMLDFLLSHGADFNTPQKVYSQFPGDKVDFNGTPLELSIQYKNQNTSMRLMNLDAKADKKAKQEFANSILSLAFREPSRPQLAEILAKQPASQEAFLKLAVAKEYPEDELLAVLKFFKANGFNPSSDEAIAEAAKAFSNGSFETLDALRERLGIDLNSKIDGKYISENFLKRIAQPQPKKSNFRSEIDKFDELVKKGLKVDLGTNADSLLRILAEYGPNYDLKYWLARGARFDTKKTDRPLNWNLINLSLEMHQAAISGLSDFAIDETELNSLNFKIKTANNITFSLALTSESIKWIVSQGLLKKLSAEGKSKYLNLSLEQGRIEIAESLVDAGAELKESEKTAALLAAIEMNDAPRMALLKKLGASVSKEQLNIKLKQMFEAKDFTQVERLIQAGATPEIDGKNIFTEAILAGFPTLAYDQVFLKYAPTDFVDLRSKKALLKLATQKNIELVRELAKRGVSLDVKVDLAELADVLPKDVFKKLADQNLKTVEFFDIRMVYKVLHDNDFLSRDPGEQAYSSSTRSERLGVDFYLDKVSEREILIEVDTLGPKLPNEKLLSLYATASLRDDRAILDKLERLHSKDWYFDTPPSLMESAIKDKNLAAINKLITSGFNIDSRRPYPHSETYRMLMAERLAEAQDVWLPGSKGKLTDKLESELIGAAIRAGNIDQLNLLKSHGIDVRKMQRSFIAKEGEAADYVAFDGRMIESPLGLAVRQGDSKMFDYFLEGTNLELYSKDFSFSRALLHRLIDQALATSDVSRLRGALEAGLEVDVGNLLRIAGTESSEISTLVFDLLAKKAKHTFNCEYLGWPEGPSCSVPLYSAIEKNPAIAMKLIDDPKEKLPQHILNRAFSMAVMSNQIEIAKKLLSLGANPNALTMGGTALSHAIAQNVSLEMLDFVISNSSPEADGIALSDRNEERLYHLQVAFDKRNILIIKRLHKAGYRTLSQYWYRELANQTMLMKFAVDSNDLDLVKSIDQHSEWHEDTEFPELNLNMRDYSRVYGHEEIYKYLSYPRDQRLKGVPLSQKEDANSSSAIAGILDLGANFNSDLKQAIEGQCRK